MCREFSWPADFHFGESKKCWIILFSLRDVWGSWTCGTPWVICLIWWAHICSPLSGPRGWHSSPGCYHWRVQTPNPLCRAVLGAVTGFDLRAKSCILILKLSQGQQQQNQKKYFISYTLSGRISTRVALGVITAAVFPLVINVHVNLVTVYPKSRHEKVRPSRCSCSTLTQLYQAVSNCIIAQLLRC